MKIPNCLIGFSAFLVCFQSMALEATNSKAPETVIANPANPVSVQTCLACDTPIAELHKASSHAQVNCASCHNMPKEHITAPTPARPTTRTDHESCSQCHPAQLKDMLDTKYHFEWAEKEGNPSYSFIKDKNGNPKLTQYRFPRFHVGLHADCVIYKMGGRFKFKNKDQNIRPVHHLWDNIVDTRPEDGDVISSKGDDAVPWKPHKGTSWGNSAYCMTCKSADTILERAWNGKKYTQTTIDNGTNALPALRKINEGFNCIFCHEPHGGKPRIINEILIQTMTNPAGTNNAYQKTRAQPE